MASIGLTFVATLLVTFAVFFVVRLAVTFVVIFVMSGPRLFPRPVGDLGRVAVRDDWQSGPNRGYGRIVMSIFWVDSCSRFLVSTALSTRPAISVKAAADSD